MQNDDDEVSSLSNLLSTSANIGDPTTGVDEEEATPHSSSSAPTTPTKTKKNNREIENTTSPTKKMVPKGVEAIKSPPNRPRRGSVKTIRNYVREKNNDDYYYYRISFSIYYYSN